MTELPRGIRNNNPGNIRLSPDKWQGLDPLNTDKDFFVFKDPVYGLRAIARILIRYQDTYGLSSIGEMIARWAPHSENDTNSYVAAVSKWTGIEAHEPIDLHTFTPLSKIVAAIVRFENGQQPYSEAQISKALILAGVEPPQPSKSGMLAGTRVAASGVGLSAILQTVQSASASLQNVAPYLQYAAWGTLALTLVGVGIAAYIYWDEHRKGIRP